MLAKQTLHSAKYLYLKLRQKAEGGRPPAEQWRRGRVKGEKVDRHKGDRLGASVGRVTGGNDGNGWINKVS
jgi:hypothetical protein